MTATFRASAWALGVVAMRKDRHVPDPQSIESIIHGAEIMGGGLAGKGGLKRLVGPSVDEIATAMARWTSFRVGNVERIGEAASKKVGDREGQVHPRVVHRLLGEGSFCDDEIMVDYLGGLLAASRTPGGRDDRAVAWSDLVTGLSSLQIRAHYLIYREMALLLRGRKDLELGRSSVRRSAALVIPLEPFAVAVAGASGVEPGEALTHAMIGLIRAGLANDTDVAWGDEMSDFWSVVRQPITGVTFGPSIVVVPSFQAMELYGWAQGVAQPSAYFTQWAEWFDVEPPLPPLNGVMPVLPPPPDTDSDTQTHG